jgi:hypothetical protein
LTFLHTVRRRVSEPFGVPLGISKMKLLRTAGAALCRRFGCSLLMYDELTRIATKYYTDKGVTIFPFHGYTRHYHRCFRALRFESVTILEIGLARKRDRGNRRVVCPSLQLWAEYFPRATILGFDLDDFSMVQLPRTRIFQGDQGKPEDLLKVVQDYPRLNIVVDDGSHASFHQQVSLRTLWPHVVGGGVYAIEDLDEQPAEIERSLPASPKTRALLQDEVGLNALIAGVGSVRLFDSPLRDATNTLGCIFKRR